MRKEVLAAIVVGFGLGLVITFGAWSANQALKNKQNQTPQVEEQEEKVTTVIPTQQVSEISPFNLVVSKPEDESISLAEKIVVSGTTEPETQIVITTEKGEEIIESDGQGVFATEITLVSGTNEIIVTAFSLKTGDEVTKIINVVYSTAEI